MAMKLTKNHYTEGYYKHHKQFAGVRLVFGADKGRLGFSIKYNEPLTCRSRDLRFGRIRRVWLEARTIAQELCTCMWDVMKRYIKDWPCTLIVVCECLLLASVIGKVFALLSLLDAEFDADHIREKRKRTSGSGGQFFRLVFSKYSKLILPFSFR